MYLIICFRKKRKKEMSDREDEHEEQTAEGGPKYEPPKKVDLADLVNQDEGDESLRKV
jgi:hypothetical protein